LTLLAAVASRVRRVDLGTAVLLPALRNPVLLAHQVATLDQVMEGRLILGVGIAADVPNIRQEFTAAGVPFEKRVGRLLEGLRLPIAPNADHWARLWNEVKEIARTAGRDPNALTGAMYLTVIIDEDPSRANERLNTYLQQYYSQPAAVMRSRQACYAGPNGGLAKWLQGYAGAGATHLVLRFAGDHERHLETVAALRSKLAC
jgi:alkanesulfonate monooxygenase SsuD/methylene tetrahydromethanopterin reductase-like flavin-dependent oxidoreductase (luciferase family)